MSESKTPSVADGLRRRFSTVEEDGLTRATTVLPIDRGALAYELSSRDASEVGLILCPSFFELKMLQASELRFAESAAKAGFYAMYLQSPGSGESFGDPEDVRISTRVEAALAGAEHARSTGKCGRVVFFGCRLGGAVAAEAAQRYEGAGFAVWDPVVEGASYLKQAKRLDRIAAMAGRRKGYEPLEEQLEHRGWATLLGNVVTQAIYDDLLGWNLGVGQTVPAASFVLCLDDGSLTSALTRLALVAPTLTTQSLGRRHLGHLGFTADDAAASIPLTVEWLKGNRQA